MDYLGSSVMDLKIESRAELSYRPRLVVGETIPSIPLSHPIFMGPPEGGGACGVLDTAPIAVWVASGLPLVVVGVALKEPYAVVLMATGYSSRDAGGQHEAFWAKYQQRQLSTQSSHWPGLKSRAFLFAYESQADARFSGYPRRRSRVVAELLPELAEQHAQIVCVMFMVAAP